MRVATSNLMTKPLTGQLLSPAQVAGMAGLSRAAVYRAIERGELRASRLCGRLRIESSEFEAWKQRSVVGPRRPDNPMVDPTASCGSGREGSFLSELQQKERA